MAETLTIISERVDDIPRLLGQLERMGLPARLDEHFPTHGNWVGLSLGWVTVVWLTHLLSQADHRLSHAEPWAEQQLHTLRRWLAAAGLARTQMDTLRLALLKIGGRVIQQLDRVRLRLASSHPSQPLWAALAARLGPMNNPG